MATGCVTITTAAPEQEPNDKDGGRVDATTLADAGPAGPEAGLAVLDASIEHAPGDAAPTVVEDAAAFAPDAADAGGPMHAKVTIAQLQQTVFTTYACGSCHPAVEKAVDLTNADKSYASLVLDKTAQCNGKPYVTPGDLSKSFLYDLLTEDDPGCDAERMPMGRELRSVDIQIVADWILGGAPR